MTGAWVGLALLMAAQATPAQPTTGPSTSAADLDDVRAREAEMFGEPEDVTAREAEMFGEPAREAEMFGEPDDVTAREAEMFGEPEDVTAREAEMFGEPSEAARARSSRTSSTTARRRRPVLPSDARSTTTTGLLQRMTDRIEELDDTLAVGGTMWLQLQTTVGEGQRIEDATLSSPNLVDVFLDGRPNDRLRGFVQGRLTYDPTVNPDTPQGLGAGGPAAQVQLDQLWVRFDLYRTVFITAGKQRIRWGSGRLWNPTDFLNQQRLNPISLFDIRLGVPLIKVHVPVESKGWNFYAVANLDQANQLRQVQGALRAELLLGDAELSLSASAREGAGERFGIDLTAPVWDFDLRAEVGVIHGDTRPRLAPFQTAVLDDTSLTPAETVLQLVPAPDSRADDWIPQIVAGAEIAIRYSDEDNLILGLEYFFNDAGYSDESVYLRLALANQFNPLDVGRHYVGYYATLVGPGDWDDTSLFLSGITNLSDLSGVVRLDLSLQLLTFLTWRVFTNVFWGDGAFSPDLSVDPALAAPETAARLAPALPLLSERIPTDPSLGNQIGDLLASDGLSGFVPLVQVGTALLIDL